MRSFVYSGAQARVVFGAGTIGQLRAEVERLGRSRVLILAGPHLTEPAQRAREVLGPLAVADFDGVAMHTPVEVTEAALAVLREYAADCLVSIGGGSATNLAKALVLRTGLPQIAVPTTYAGSEATPVLGETANGVKTTQTSAALLPQTVLYDVELTRNLPVGLSVTSGINALAHAVEALYSNTANPVADSLAVESITRLARALPRIVEAPTDLDARSDALLGAWLAGVCLGSVGMGLHHKLCHLLGGSFGLPHSETHTVVLPHAMAYNAPAAPEAMRRIAAALGVREAPAGMYDLVVSLGGPTALRELGMAEEDLPRAAALASAAPYPNPREVTGDGVAGVLRAAWQGSRPAGPPDVGWLTTEVVDSFGKATDLRVKHLVSDLVRRLHDFVESNDVTENEWLYAIDFLTRTGHLSGPTRQEFILLSDTLGISSMVDLLTNSRTPTTTPSAVLGPFYVDGPPVAESGADITAGAAGAPLWADIRVTDVAGQPIAGATVDVWQTNDDGFYDVQLPGEGPALRARFQTDKDGRFTFWSILPSAYPIPDDGPVGQLLSATGRHPFRAPHLHFMISAPGYRRLVTQLFVAGGEYLDSDAVFGVKDELIVDFAERHDPTPDGRPLEGAWHSLEFTFHIGQ
jgi:alcohol dehydrogenase class IV/protocatechuate 3,4-dioxygenase beta subunit